MMNLREAAMLAVVKFALWQGEELPEEIRKELRLLEEATANQFTSRYRDAMYVFGKSDFEVSFGWSRGKWTFALVHRESAVVNIKAGKDNRLGVFGGQLFLLPPSRVVIEDFYILLNERTVTFYGSYSTLDGSADQCFKSTFSITGEPQSSALRIETQWPNQKG